MELHKQYRNILKENGLMPAHVKTGIRPFLYAANSQCLKNLLKPEVPLQVLPRRAGFFIPL